MKDPWISWKRVHGAFDDRFIFPNFKYQELHNLIYKYSKYKVDETKYFDYFWVDK